MVVEMKWGGAEQRPHRVGCPSSLSSGHSCFLQLQPCRTQSNQIKSTQNQSKNTTHSENSIFGIQSYFRAQTIALDAN